MPDGAIFSEEYVANEPAQPAESAATQQELQKQIETEVKRYGTGKPERVVVIAHVSHD